MRIDAGIDLHDRPFARAQDTGIMQIALLDQLGQLEIFQRPP
jgi:hypothetical protein